MSNVIHRLRDNDAMLLIKYDTIPLNPRLEFEHDSMMVCCHRRYDLGDHSFNSVESAIDEMARYILGDERFDDFLEEIENIESYDEIINILRRDAVILPLYLYDHSGITMNTTGFSDPWDSGMVGWISLSNEKIKEIYGVEEINDEIKEKARELLVKEVEIYDMYLTGDIYGFDLYDKGTLIDSCYGFYGSNFRENGMYETVPKEYRYLFDLI